ncbi:MAG: high light inducible protein [Candidatus Moranbacteria bacterium CG23_combo_of_CG06-09_8_20_14_all_35_22]|nr:MAG: high light inducible protein [Candidatus Moranbacteria bacterium CG23_combo_of_CG06-09_8_20_14_all_35_22]
MKIYTKEIFIPNEDLKLSGLDSIRNYYNKKISPKLSLHKPIRFVVVKTDGKGYHCEIDFVVQEKSDKKIKSKGSIFDFYKRQYENIDQFNAVLIIPTGVGAEIGGHCGDGNAVARLIASACDTLITHPNVVNASDINEMTENTLYTEGSLITRLLMGQIGLQKVRMNKILMLMDKHQNKFFNDEVINAVSSARVTLGLDCDVLEMSNAIECKSKYAKSGRATGEIKHLERLLNLIKKYVSNYDAIGLSSFIQVPSHYHEQYFCKNENMVNPWGGIEAMLTHSIAEIFNIPCAHSPMMTSQEVMNLNLGIVDPRKAPESASVTYLHCILKGLHKAPRITTYNKGLNVESISCLIVPDKSLGLPTLACLEQGIPVIAVRKNKNNMNNDLRKLPFKQGKLFVVDNYLEAVGVMNALKSGISIESVKCPIKYTNYFRK